MNTIVTMTHAVYRPGVVAGIQGRAEVRAGGATALNCGKEPHHSRAGRQETARGLF